MREILNHGRGEEHESHEFTPIITKRKDPFFCFSIGEHSCQFIRFVFVLIPSWLKNSVGVHMIEEAEDV